MDIPLAGGRLRLAALVIVVAVLFFAGIRQGSIVLSRPSFCASCHVMSAQYVSQQRSAHARASCVDCHSGRRCGSCHTAAGADDTMARRAVNASGHDLHAEHEQPVAGCSDCHSGIMHARIDGVVRRDPWRSCGGCHGQTGLESSMKRHPVRGQEDMERQ